MNPTERLSSMVQITDYEEAVEIVRSKHIRQARDHEPDFMPQKADTLVVIHGPEHAERRRMEVPLFLRRNLVRLETEVLERALDAAVRTLPDETRTDLLELVRAALVPVTVAVVGLDPQGPDWWDEIFAYVRANQKLTALNWKQGDVDEEMRMLGEVNDRFTSTFVEPAWGRRVALVEAVERGETEAGSLPTDLLTQLALHLPERDLGVAARESILYFGASIGTTTFAIATTIFHLVQWCEEHPEDRGRLDLGFLQAAAYEAIRLHPPPGLIRMLTTEITLASGRRIQAGQEIYIPLGVVNRDPSIFGEDADGFHPGRPIAAGVKPYGFGFGGGAHKCIGRPLATSHHEALKDATLDDAVGTVVRVVRRLLELGVELDPGRPPVMWDGNLQERYLEFPIVLRPSSSISGGVRSTR